nr:hypothetical protein [Tanacetum cinerariifolium]
MTSEDWVDIRSTLKFLGLAFEAAVQRAVDALLPGLTTRLTMRSIKMALGEVVTNLPASTPGWKVKSWKEMLSIGGRILNKPKKILDGIVNTKFTDVAQVANAARNIEILDERSSQNNKLNSDGDRIRPTAQDNNQRGYDQKGYNGRTYGRQGGNNSQKSWQNRGHQYNRSSGSLGKACHRVAGTCFTCSLTGHIARDFPKNGENDGRGNGNDNQPAAKGWVFSLTKDQKRFYGYDLIPNNILIHDDSEDIRWLVKMEILLEPTSNKLLGGEPYLPVLVPETFHEQTNEEVTKNDIKRMDADDQAIQTILLGFPEDVYATIDSCEIAKEIWERVRQMMKG